MNKMVDRTFLGISGINWCLIAGLGFGTQNVFAKLAYQRGLQVPTFILIRHFVLLVGAYLGGKLRNINFDLRAYPRESIKLVFKRSFLGMMSKSM